VKAKEAADFPTTLTSAKTHWDNGRYGACLSDLHAAVLLASQKRAEAVVAALPAAPAGWNAVPDKSRDQMQNNAFAQAMGAGLAAAGNVVQHEYKQQGGSGRVQVTITADSPLVAMFNAWIANPAMLEKGAELIRYEAHSAVLKKPSGSLQLQILIHDKHLCDVDARGMTEDQLFALFDQKAVDALAGVLGA
jgi:hypothetical protein